MSDTHVGENFLSFICFMKTVWNNKNVTFASVILYKYVSAMTTCGSFPLVVEAACICVCVCVRACAKERESKTKTVRDSFHAYPMHAFICVCAYISQSWRI